MIGQPVTFNVITEWGNETRYGHVEAIEDHEVLGPLFVVRTPFGNIARLTIGELYDDGKG